MVLDYSQWSSVESFITKKPDWIPEDDRLRIGAYEKYDATYWNDPTQYKLRVLQGEKPLYIPNARVIVDTTASFILKGLSLRVNGSDVTTTAALNAFLDREMFYSRFNTAKTSGVARGDFVFHMTANPKKAQGKRLSLNSVDPSNVFPIYDDDAPDKMVGCHIAVQYVDADDPEKVYVRKLTYRLVEEGESRRVSREEAIFEIDPNNKWYSKKPKKVRDILPLGLLDPAITTIPIYWFKNRDWDGQLYGSSELRGLETLSQAASQSATDINMALALEGLGVYATDGGRPVDDYGNETAWEVAPGRVMEVPTGSYFRRVEGVGSITPAKEHIDYMEDKMLSGAGITDIALGRADVAIAQSGIALAIKFMPTLAKVEARDQLGINRLKQLFYDWRIWHQVFERQALSGEIIVEIGDKLPTDRTARVNELNNMIDRKVISRQYYREEMVKLGYVFPPDIETQIDEDRMAEVAEKTAAQGNTGDGGNTIDQGNQSNNKSRPNESAGTEATQSVEAQTRDVTS